MQPYRFTITGHQNISATHSTTLEFTKEAHLSAQGDCIVGVRATFDAELLKRFLTCAQLRIVIRAGKEEQIIIAIPNPSFDDSQEIVIRMGAHSSARTLATAADCAAKYLKRTIIRHLQNPGNTASVEVSCHGS